MASVRIRMYRQGLGDCFLLTFDADGRKPAHALIDCGVFFGTKNATGLMADIANDVLKTTGGRLDVLIATHEHWDHLSGFVQARAVFDQLDVGDVWLAWTEDPDDELAGELRGIRRRAVDAVAAASEALGEAGTDRTAFMASRLRAVLEFHGDFAAAGGRSTADALDWMKAKAKGRVRYLRPGELLPALGVSAFVLGPPHDRELIKRSDPSRRDSEVYELDGDRGVDRGFLAALDPQDELEADDEQPFGPARRLDAAAAEELPLFADRYLAEEADWRQVEHDWLGAAGSLALRLDSDTNNTSLVLAFELSPGGPVLLFPGDAQVGNWLSWESLSWSRDGGEVVRADDLLARTVLYKVGHHGSHNATLRERGLELMSSPELTAMIPVGREMAKAKKWNMPFPPLLERLNEKAHGRVIEAGLGIAAQRPAGLTTARWKDFNNRVDVQDRWIDYTVEW